MRDAEEYKWGLALEVRQWTSDHGSFVGWQIPEFFTEPLAIRSLSHAPVLPIRKEI